MRKFVIVLMIVYGVWAGWAWTDQDPAMFDVIQAGYNPGLAQSVHPIELTWGGQDGRGRGVQGRS